MKPTPEQLSATCQGCGQRYDVYKSARFGCLEPTVYCGPTCRSASVGLGGTPVDNHLAARVLELEAVVGKVREYQARLQRFTFDHLIASENAVENVTREKMKALAGGYACIARQLAKLLEEG